MALDITLLGAPGVERDGEAVTFDTRKAMALLALLALAERPRSRETLCGLLWPAHDPDRARGALRRTLSTLRKGIGDEWIDPAGDSLALRRGPGLELDVARFRGLTADGASEEHLGEAAALFSGDFMEGFSLRDSPEFDDWQTGEARALERELASALRRLVELLVARGDFEYALPRAQRWLRLDPLHEPAHRELIRLYAWSGERAAALEQYRTCVRTLSQELGVAPVEETATLYEQLNEGGLALPPVATASAAAPPAAKPGAPPELPLVGREDELTALLAAHAAARPDGGLAVIEGEAGIGKTRLAAASSSERLRGRVRRAGHRHAQHHLVALGEVVRHQLRLGALKHRLDRLQRGALGAGRFMCVLAVDLGLADVEAGLKARAGERGVGPLPIAGVRAEAIAADYIALAERLGWPPMPDVWW